jgi:hypothetical protein
VERRVLDLFAVKSHFARMLLDTGQFAVTLLKFISIFDHISDFLVFTVVSSSLKTLFDLLWVHTRNIKIGIARQVL